ncbi:MAG: hypothetical protein LBE56_12485 [Tannerella sp.]|nr:hypothetical protein [Tannerella sp.]
MQRRYITHEYGHSIQSCYLGFFYFIVIGLPSLFFTGFNSAQAKRMYMERWAERLIRDVVLEDVEEPP